MENIACSHLGIERFISLSTFSPHIESLNLTAHLQCCVMWLSHRIELKESNFPENLVKVFLGQAMDIARRCVEAPLRRRPK